VEQPKAAPAEAPRPVELVGDAAAAWLSGVLTSLGYGSAIVSVVENDTRIELQITGHDALEVSGARNAAARTDVVDSLQYLASKAVFGSDKTAKAVIIDVEGFRASREKAVATAADRVAAAAASGRTVRFAATNSIDRRAFHQALEKHRGTVRTESEGEGATRRLRAFGTRKQGGEGGSTPEE
jgi:predicted RNA-binding protein Jag